MYGPIPSLHYKYTIVIICIYVYYIYPGTYDYCMYHVI